MDLRSGDSDCLWRHDGIACIVLEPCVDLHHAERFVVRLLAISWIEDNGIFTSPLSERVAGHYVLFPNLVECLGYSSGDILRYEDCKILRGSLEIGHPVRDRRNRSLVSLDLERFFSHYD